MKKLILAAAIASFVCGSVHAQDASAAKHTADVAISAQVCSVYFEIQSEINKNLESSINDKQASLLATVVSSTIYFKIRFPIEKQIEMRSIINKSMRQTLVNGGVTAYNKFKSDNEVPCSELVKNPNTFIAYANDPSQR